MLRDAKPDGLSDSENAHKELSAQCSSNDATTAYSGDESDNKHAEEGSSSDAKETHLEKRSYVMQELIETEQKYVQDLALIIDGYIPTMKDENCEIPMPDDLKSGKDKMVFGNIENIYSWHNEYVPKKNYLIISINCCVYFPLQNVSKRITEMFRSPCRIRSFI